MLDFTPVRNKEKTIGELAAGLTRDNLHDLTNEMIDRMLDLIADCVDADVTFVPVDPDAHDPSAADEADTELAWTLGHVIVHTTASSEESAALAAELARGVEFHGRSRSEVPWQTVTTIEQCRQRLEESRRMRLVSLEMWPDDAYLDNTYVPYPSIGPINAVGRFIFGLSHDTAHLEQITKIAHQAKATHNMA